MGPTAFKQQLTTAPSYLGRGELVSLPHFLRADVGEDASGRQPGQVGSHTALEALKLQQKFDRKSHRNQGKTPWEVGLTMRQRRFRGYAGFSPKVRSVLTE